jgi:uncharacterized membrane protein (DUF485 family)
MSDNVNQAITEPAGSAGNDTGWTAIRRLPGYRALIRTRRRLVVPLAVVYLAGYFGFLILAGTAPAMLGHSVHDGLTVGFVLMGGVFVLVWLVALVYVRVSNARLDRQAEEVAEEARKVLASGGRGAAS